MRDTGVLRLSRAEEPGRSGTVRDTLFAQQYPEIWGCFVGDCDLRPCRHGRALSRLCAWSTRRSPRHWKVISIRSRAPRVTTTRSSISWVIEGSSSSARPLTGPTISTRSGPASPDISSTNVDSMPWRWRRIGPTPTGSTATSWGSQMMLTPIRHSRTSNASRPGCGGTAMSWPLWNGSRS